MSRFFQELKRRNVFRVGVLPLVNMSADAEQEYSSDGISRELLNRLAIACGQDGFDTWQPSDAECGRDTTPTAPN